MSFLEVWILYSIIGAIAFSYAFVWAVRTRQFTELDRQRYIALNAEKMIEQPCKTPAKVDKYTWLGLVIITALVIAAALWVAMICSGHTAVSAAADKMKCIGY